jgi:hypothetical protein
MSTRRIAFGILSRVARTAAAATMTSSKIRSWIVEIMCPTGRR